MVRLAEIMCDAREFEYASEVAVTVVSQGSSEAFFLDGPPFAGSGDRRQMTSLFLLGDTN